jgi:CheY-like chemotaxis protein
MLVSPIAEDVVSLLRASLPETIEIRFDLQTGTGTVYADPTQIHQVLMNLCTNAVRAMREKGGILDVILSEVEMDAAALAGLPEISPGDYLRMTVSDTGEGMSSEVLDRIFDPYFSTKERSEGAGLGLSVVHGIMKSHGGAITVRSKPRKGTTFHVYLPLLKHRAEPEERIGVYKPLPGGNERILFVEDEEDMVFMVGQLLESLGYEVVTRTNGMDALALFREQPDRFDLVITDMTLPGMTGERLAEQIKKIRRDTPIILCTGFGEDITKEKAEKMGVREVILKPLVNIDLTKTIRKVLDETNICGNI